jgi:serine/threonine protein kinase
MFQLNQLPQPDQKKINEAKILAKLYHTNILKLYEWWVECSSEGTYLFLQLEFC